MGGNRKKFPRVEDRPFMPECTHGWVVYGEKKVEGSCTSLFDEWELVSYRYGLLWPAMDLQFVTSVFPSYRMAWNAVRRTYYHKYKKVYGRHVFQGKLKIRRLDILVESVRCEPCESKNPVRYIPEGRIYGYDPIT